MRFGLSVQKLFVKWIQGHINSSSAATVYDNDNDDSDKNNNSSNDNNNNGNNRYALVVNIVSVDALVPLST